MQKAKIPIKNIHRYPLFKKFKNCQGGENHVLGITKPSSPDYQAENPSHGNAGY